MKSGHEFDFNNTEIRRADKDYYRLILEGIEIKFAGNLVNLQAGSGFLMNAGHHS